MRIVMLFLAIVSSSPSSALTALKGENLFSKASVDLEAGDKRGSVLIFMSAKCPCSNSHVGAIKKMMTDFPQFKFAVVHSNGEETVEQARTYFKDKGLTDVVVGDADHQLADRFGASRTPHAFVVLPDGKVAYRGGVSDSHDGEHAKFWPLREALEDVRDQKKLRHADARALGCAISRSR